MTEIVARSIEEDWVVVPGIVDTSLIGNVRDKAVIETLLRARNEVWLGRPQVFDLRHTNSSKSEMLNYVLATHDLFVFHFACSFRPAPYCEFVQATVSISVSSSSNSESTETPIIYDLFPTEVFMPVTYKRTFSIDPHLKFDVVKVLQTEASAFKAENSREFVIYQPAITTYGKGGETAGWDFNKVSSRPIIGIKDLFVLVKRIKGDMISLNVSVYDCTIQTNLGSLPLTTLFPTKSKGVLLSETLTIS